MRRLKGLILRGEARDAAHACKLAESRVEFLDLPFYEQGRYRRFDLSGADVEKMAEILEKTQPHQIFLTGHVADPSSLQALCYVALKRAVDGLGKAKSRSDCRIWAYRGKEKALEPYEIDMAVPMSPGQLEGKKAAIHKFQSIRQDEREAPKINQLNAKSYDLLGMAEYEAIEAFQRLA